MIANSSCDQSLFKNFSLRVWYPGENLLVEERIFPVTNNKLTVKRRLKKKSLNNGKLLNYEKDIKMKMSLGSFSLCMIFTGKSHDHSITSFIV